MKALVTGAHGFCGTHLRRYLEGQGVEVHTLGVKGNGERHHYADPLDVTALTGAVSAAAPGYVFHLAGVTTAEDPTVYYRINTAYAAALLHALEAAGRQSCPVLLIGTSAEYGVVREDQLPINEDVPPRPYNHYGVSKLGQTLMGFALADAGRPLVMVRPFNIIGPGMPEHLSIAGFARQITDIMKGRSSPVISVGNLNTSRDFVDVEDVVTAYWRLIRTPSAYGQVINICSGSDVAIADLLAKLIAMSGMPIEVRTDSARLKPIDVPRHYGSAEKFRALLGYALPTTLDQSLNRILAHLLEQP